jgi:cytochrome b
MKQTKKQLNQTKINLAVESGIFFGFLIAEAPHFTGMAVHEWLGIAFGAGIITHLLLHWQWIVAITRRFFSDIPRQARLNYLLNLLLFIDITLTIYSGLMISREALPTLGLSLGEGGAWRGIHTLAANLSLALVGLHVALHWQWIVKAIKRYIVQPLSFGHPVAQPSRVTKLTQKGVSR